MPRKKSEHFARVLILRDGVFIADDDRRDEGDQCEVAEEVARKLIENGHAKRI